MYILRSPTVLATIATCILTAGCTDGTIGPENGGATRVLLTDAPFPFHIVERVDIHVVRIDASSVADTSGGNHWMTVAEPDAAFDLLELQRGTTALLGEQELPADQYRAVRMVIDTDRSRVVRRDTAEAFVQWPVAGELTLHALVEEPVDVSADGATIVIDFDVGRSFFVAGDNHFIFIPWIRAVNQGRTGTLFGTVTAEATGAPVPDATISVYYGSIDEPDNTWSLAATGRSESDGSYVVSFLLPGTYIARAEPLLSPGLGTAQVEGVTIIVGNETRADLALPEEDLSGLAIFGPQSVEEGHQITLQAVLLGVGGDSLNADVQWTNLNEDLVTLEPNGARATITGLVPGMAHIKARNGELEDSIDVTVIEVLDIGSLTLSPASQTLAIGETGTVTAAVTDPQGRALPNVPVSWALPDSTGLALVEIDLQSISLRAEQVGTYLVRGVAGDKQATAQVVVHEQ